MRKTQRKRRLKEKRRRERERGLRNLEEFFGIKDVHRESVTKFMELEAELGRAHMQSINTRAPDIDWPAEEKLSRKNAKAAEHLPREYGGSLDATS